MGTILLSVYQILVYFKQVHTVSYFPEFYYMKHYLKVQPRNIAVKDFCKSIQVNRKTVSDEELSKFDDFTLNLGQNG